MVTVSICATRTVQKKRGLNLRGNCVSFARSDLPQFAAAAGTVDCSRTRRRHPPHQQHNTLRCALHARVWLGLLRPARVMCVWVAGVLLVSNQSIALRERRASNFLICRGGGFIVVSCTKTAHKTGQQTHTSPIIMMYALPFRHHDPRTRVLCTPLCKLCVQLHTLTDTTHTNSVEVYMYM